MEVILNEKIRNLGDLGEKVNVKPGYARNFLIPQGKGLQATAKNLEIFEKNRAELEKVAAGKLAEANAKAEKLNEFVITITAKTGEGGRLFGSIGTRDLAEQLAGSGVEIGKHQVRLPEGVIRQTGEYEVSIHLHTDVDAIVKVIVKEDETEA